MAGIWPDDEGFGGPPCHCYSSEADHRLFAHVRSVGTDVTDSRYADVTVEKCRDCGLHWLRYSVEYEGFTKSGRWGRAQIGWAEAEEVTPELAVAYLERGTYAYGGSYFHGASGWRNGPMYWGI